MSSENSTHHLGVCQGLVQTAYRSNWLTKGNSMAALDSDLAQPGDNPVDVPILCVVTRFGLRSPHHMLPTYLDYRTVMREVQSTGTPGLLRSAFLIESPTACYSLSLWSNWDAIPRFGTNVPYHVRAGNRIFGRLAITKERGFEIWSTKWKLVSVSNNLNWGDFDLRAVILGMQS
jgi:hypothetical protein